MANKPTAANGFGTNIAYSSTDPDALALQRYKETPKPVNRDAIRREKVAQFQAEIDATNQIYSSLIAKANLEGEDRLGQQRALLARSGLIGSARGGALNEQVLTQNRGIINDYETEKMGKVSSLMRTAQQLADEEIMRREEARQQGGREFLQYQTNVAEQKRANAQAILGGMVAQDLKLQDIPESQWNQIAKTLRMTPDELRTVYMGEAAKRRSEMGIFDDNGETTIQLNDKETAAVDKSTEKKNLESLAGLKQAAERYRNLVQQEGFAVKGAGKALLDQAYADLQVRWKEAANLGALTGPDLKLLADAVKPVTGVKGIWNKFSGTGKNAILTSLNSAIENINKRGNDAYNQLIRRNSKYQYSPYIQGFGEPFGVMPPKQQQQVESLFNELGGQSSKADKSSIGGLSERYESGGNPGAIGHDSTGGWSYGTYQLAHNNVDRFLAANPEFGKYFKGMKKGTTAFNETWKKVASRLPGQFKEAQKQFIAKTHFEPQAKKLASIGVNINNLSNTVKDVIWSTAVQHGGNTNVIANAFKKVGKNANEAALIKAIYNERWNGGKNFASSTKGVKNAVYNRFFGKNGEMNKALASLRSRIG